MSGTFTFMFTDIERHSALWSGSPDRVADLLDALRQRTSAALSRAHGRMVSDTGDGAFCVFDTAGRAVAAAHELMASLVTDPITGPLDAGPLRVRIGIHTGVAEHRDANYYGPGPGVCRRIVDAAHGGQILLSGAAAELFNQEPHPAPVPLRLLGSYTLRGFGHHRLLQLGPGEFPPPRGVSAGTNVTPHLTAFIGREHELKSLTRTLRASRLATITGPGGAGKTRLAREFALASVTAFEDGVWFVDLSSMAAPADASRLVAQELKLATGPQATDAERIADWLAGKRLLLILNNADAFPDAVGSLACQWLEANPGLSVIATGRTPLGVPGEARLPLRPLSLTDGVASLDALRACDAVKLFTDRARLQSPEWELTPANAAAVVDLVGFVGGLPLGIEIVAACTDTMSVSQIAAGLNLHALPRLADAIEWSVARLDDDAALAFDALSVFAEGFTAPAADAVLQSLHLPGDVLSRLVRRSLIAFEPDDPAGGRYSMLHPIAEVAAARLRRRDQLAETLRQAHFRWFASFAPQAAAGWTSSEPGAPDRSNLQLRAERHNITRALEAAPDENARYELAYALHQWWHDTGQVRERAWFDRVVRDAGWPPDDLRLGRALNVVGMLAFQGAQFDDAVAAYQRSLEVWRLRAAADPGAVDVDRVGILLKNIAGCLTKLRRFDEARTAFAESALWLAKPTRARADKPNAEVLHQHALDLAALEIETGRLTEALTLLDTCESHFTSAQDRSRLATARINRGEALFRAGHLAAAVPAYLSGLTVRGDIGDASGVSRSLLWLARCLIGLDRLQPARTAFDASNAWRRCYDAAWARADHGLADELSSRLAPATPENADSLTRWPDLRRWLTSLHTSLQTH